MPSSRRHRAAQLPAAVVVGSEAMRPSGGAAVPVTCTIAPWGGVAKSTSISSLPASRRTVTGAPTTSDSARRLARARWLSNSSITTTHDGLPRAQLFHVGAAVENTTTTSPSPNGCSRARGAPFRSESSLR